MPGHRLSELAKDSIRSVLKFFGYEISKIQRQDLLDFTPELSSDAKSIIRTSAAYSMTSMSRLISNYKACYYVVANNVAGDHVYGEMETGFLPGRSLILRVPMTAKCGYLTLLPV